jgi:hypothetical protein
MIASNSVKIEQENKKKSSRIDIIMKCEFSDNVGHSETKKSLYRARIKGETNQFQEYNRNCFDFFTHQSIFRAGLLEIKVQTPPLPLQM